MEQKHMLHAGLRAEGQAECDGAPLLFQLKQAQRTTFCVWKNINWNGVVWWLSKYLYCANCKGIWKWFTK